MQRANGINNIVLFKLKIARHEMNVERLHAQKIIIEMNSARRIGQKENRFIYERRVRSTRISK